MPRGFKYAIWIVATFALVPVAMVFHARTVKSEKPRIHFIQDMDKQPGYRAQSTSPIFADGRADRQPILTTVAYGKLEDDDHYYRGYSVSTNPETKQADVAVWFNGLPSQVKVNQAFMDRGQERFNIYCASCHGYDGKGNGPVNIRANTINAGTTGWIPPLDLTAEQTINQTDGFIYNSIRNGVRNMPALGSQIPVEDRWAIVAYVRALQLSQAGENALDKSHNNASK
jgi:mono/diheme cytochrome c family protein